MTVYACEGAEDCKEPAKFRMPAGEMLCEKCGRAERLGICGDCTLGIVISDEGQILACNRCAEGGAGFGDANHVDDDEAANHLQKIAAVMEDLSEALAADEGAETPPVLACYRDLASLTLTSSIEKV